MQKMMPLGPYQSNTGITLGTILQPSEDSIVGYFVEVDLNYPSHVHDCHNGLPLAPEKVWLATTLHLLGFLLMQFLLRRNLDQKIRLPLLKTFVKQVLQASKVHRVCKIQQNILFGLYTEKNTMMHKQAANGF